MYCSRLIFLFFFVTVSLAAMHKPHAMHLLHERMEVTYYNPEYLASVNVSTRRASRREVAVSNVHAILKHSWGNNITVELVMFEFLSNEYRRSFVQVRNKVCDTVEKNPFLSPLLKQTELVNKTCPYAPGPYHLTNISFPPSIIPVGFPFRKGRVDLEVTLTENKQTLIVKGHTHFEIRGQIIKKPRS